MDEAALRRAWESSQRSTKEDWAEWMRHFAVELLRHSPSPALRATYPLAQVGAGTLIYKTPVDSWLIGPTHGRKPAGLLPPAHLCPGSCLVRGRVAVRRHSRAAAVAARGLTRRSAQEAVCLSMHSDCDMII